MTVDKQLAENVFFIAQCLEELDKTMERRLDELTAACENPTAEEVCQAHVLAALVMRMNTEKLADMTETHEGVKDLADTAYVIARAMTLRNIESYKSNGG